MPVNLEIEEQIVRVAPPSQTPPGAPRYDVSLLTAEDLYLFNEGNHFRLYQKLGAHPLTAAGERGTYFAVWAPEAESVSVLGDFNRWEKNSHPLKPRASSGVWEAFIPGVERGALYKYHLASRHRGYRADKADPFGFLHEKPPATGSVVWDLDYAWRDQDWMRGRGSRNAHQSPMSIYEVHLGSWRRVPEENRRSLTYREIAPLLADHVEQLGFTHVELLPVMEHPFYGSWGYQVTGFFAPSSRYGTPQDFMYLVDTLHQRGIGVILDWVGSHFPCDGHGPGYFDGTHLFEHADPRRGMHPIWKSFLFNYGRNEVRSFLISSALFWLAHYHADGLRLDAVTTMLYLDDGRKKGQWLPNAHGGRENLEAISFLRRLNQEVYRSFPDVQTIAEESSAWPKVSRPLEEGGLGFGLKWDMGWMNDTLDYLKKDPGQRNRHHKRLTFRMLYAFHENFVLPLSHDEVVHLKGSLLSKMPGDDWRKFANLRLLLGQMYGQPGKKLLFMGAELAQRREWTHEESLDWHLLQFPPHAGVQKWLADLNRFYRSEPALHERDGDPGGFEWIDCHNAAQSAISFIRRGSSDDDLILVVCNFTPTLRRNWRVGVPRGGFWNEVLNSDAGAYGGSGAGNLGGLPAQAHPYHGRPFSLELTLPPLAAIFFKSQAGR
jgi:1,4-alpha-glucan branching enzyme